MTNATWIFAVICISYILVLNLCDACEAGGYCTVEKRAPWGLFNASCGRGVHERQRAICCDTSKYYSLKGCLTGCNIPFIWWQANATEHKTCGKCQRGGKFNVIQNSCICPSGYGGSCCDLRTKVPTSMKTTTTTIPDRWAPWEACNDTCGGQGGLSPPGVQQRQKYIGCDRTKYNSLIACLNGCNITFSWWQANATEFQSCRKCQQGGQFNSSHNRCICPNGYGGACCDDKDDCTDQPCQYGKCMDEIDDFFCDFEEWASWGSCNATCGGGGGVQKRQKYICCDELQYSTLEGCLTGCTISSSWWQANAAEHQRCGNCSLGGTFDLTQNRCICPLGYGGSCCDVKTTTTITTTVPTTTRTPTTLPTTKSTTTTTATTSTSPTTITTTLTTTKPTTTTTATTSTSPTTITTTLPTTKPTTTTTATTSTSPTTITTTSVTTPTFTTSPTHKSTTRTTLLTTIIKPTTQSITKLTATQKGTGLSSCVGYPCQHGTCIPVDHHYICLCPSGYEGQNCDKDKDDCANGPCLYGTCHDKVDDFHCDCVFFFKGKMCNKLPSWAIAGIALSSLAVLLICCCCWKWIMGICNRDEEQTKVQPMKEKIKAKPMERQPRYDRW
ncbi:unnamed protein product [Mytilus edulis]|uniref:EGF-like domain-containing protein n=1 Tax=Mytilus edulis TaxID=6550 RepID=A0A8S3SNL9_MYTED|nr:unnamed protein product [Mytilus edulis]